MAIASSRTRREPDPAGAAPAPLYRSLAGQLARLIERGTFRAGDRLPSVRALARQRTVSVTTVLEAYRLLEDGGWIEPRPQSGYFVRARLLRMPEEPAPTTPPRAPGRVVPRDLVSEALRWSGRSKLVALGAAVPSMELLPTRKLNRILASVARHPRQRTYETPAGCRELRMQIARRMVASGCDLTPEDVLVTNGCQEAVTIALRVTCRPGDTVLVESPAYFGFLQAADLLGLKVLEVRTYPRQGICLDEIKAALQRHPVRALLLNPNFQNPLGSLMPDWKKEALVALLAEREIPLIEDDIFGELAFGLERPRTLKSWDREGLVLLCSSFSKTLTPGYRIGWIAAGRYRAEVERQKAVTNVSTAAIPQLAIAEFLADGGYDRHLRRLRRAFASQITLMTQAVLDAFPDGTKICRPAGGFLLWIEMPAGHDAVALHETALKAGITIAPGPMFSARGGHANCIRLSAGAWSAEIRRGVETLGRLARTATTG